MSDEREIWKTWDTRLEREVGVGCYPTEAYATLMLEGFRERDARGGRKDLHDKIPFWIVRKRDGQGVLH